MACFFLCLCFVLVLLLRFVNRGHAINSQECVSLIHYKQSNPFEPYKHTLNLVASVSRNAERDNFSTITGAKWAQSIAVLYQSAYGIDGLVSNTRPMQEHLMLQEAALSRKTAEDEEHVARDLDSDNYDTTTEFKHSHSEPSGDAPNVAKMADIVSRPRIRRRSSYLVMTDQHQPQQSQSSSDTLALAEESRRKRHRDAVFVKLHLRPFEMVYSHHVIFGTLKVGCCCLMMMMIMMMMMMMMDDDDYDDDDDDDDDACI